MILISQILSSQSRVEVLSVMTRNECGLPLRQLAALAKTSLTATRAAVDGLAKLSVLRTERRGNRKLITFNIKHPSADLLKQIFELMHKTELTKRVLDRRDLLSFNSQALSMINQARRDIR